MNPVFTIIFLRRISDTADPVGKYGIFHDSRLWSSLKDRLDASLYFILLPFKLGPGPLSLQKLL